MKLKEQLERKIRAEGKSSKTFETYWHYCEDYFLWLKNAKGCWTHPKDAGRSETTEIYLHADKNGATAAHSPLTQLLKSEHMHAPVQERVTGPVTLKLYRGEAV